MIAQLSGGVAAKDERAVLVEVAGVGYRVNVPADTLAEIKIGQAITLHTHLAVREDALELFGFATKFELDYFHLLITVPGIGPKSALAILSLAAPEVLRKAIAAEDTSYLTRVSGIGRKNAEKIILTLKDKMTPAGNGTDAASKINLAAETEALEALKALGYSTVEARAALKKAGRPEGQTDTGDTSARIKTALKALGGR